jgi:hypothetical protein
MYLRGGIFVALFCLALPCGASAQISRGWFNYAFNKLGADGIKALSVVQEEGLILSRIRKDYAAFSFGSQRLSAVNRKSETIDVSEFGTVLEFETCAPTSDLLSGKIHKARLRHKSADADKLADEILDINEFFFRATNENWKIKLATKASFVGSHVIPRSIDGASHRVEIEFRMMKEGHHIVLEASAPSICEKP